MARTLRIYTEGQISNFGITKIETGKYWATETRDESILPAFKIESDRHGWTCQEKGGGIVGSGKTIENALQSAVSGKVK